jgi:hypothetical protein
MIEITGGIETASLLDTGSNALHLALPQSKSETPMRIVK